MKKILIALLIISACKSQQKRPLVGVTAYQQQLNASYKDASKSPLTKSDLNQFKSLDFFPIDSSFIVTATLIPTTNATIFEMVTTTNRRPLYKEFGTLNFILKGKNCTLKVYQSQETHQEEKYKNHLFLPFTDLTSGNESYGAGRYMDIKTTDIQKNNTVILNFNNTYNPYCAYNPIYSCPLTPRENHLNIAVKAGIKAFKKH